MADWGEFARLLGMAQYGDDVRKVEARKRKEGVEAEELGFRRDENMRAGAREGRASEEAEYGKTRRGAKEEAENLGLESARFKVGRQPIEAQQSDEDQQFQRNEQGRADKRLKLSEMQIAISRMIAQANAGRRADMDARSAEDQNIQRANTQSQFDAQQNPMNDEMAQLRKLQAVVNSSDDEDAVAQAQAEIMALQGSLDRERALRATKRQIVSGR